MVVHANELPVIVNEEHFYWELFYLAFGYCVGYRIKVGTFSFIAEKVLWNKFAKLTCQDLMEFNPINVLFVSHFLRHGSDKVVQISFFVSTQYSLYVYIPGRLFVGCMKNSATCNLAWSHSYWLRWRKLETNGLRVFLLDFVYNWFVRISIPEYKEARIEMIRMMYGTINVKFPATVSSNFILNKDELILNETVK